MHWWVTNKTQSGRGTTTVTGIPNIPTLDVGKLTGKQLAAARSAFDAMKERRFLPFDQIDEDPARAELDRRLLVDVLGLPESVVDEGGPIDLLRRKLAHEPQIHGGKKTRVVFQENGERSERRDDGVGGARFQRRRKAETRAMKISIANMVSKPQLTTRSKRGLITAVARTMNNVIAAAQRMARDQGRGIWGFDLGILAKQCCDVSALYLAGGGARKSVDYVYGSWGP